MEDTHRLAEILGGLSLATDFSAGQAPECAIGATIISLRLAALMGLSESDLTDTYYTAITRFIGCTSTAMEVAPAALGDDISLNYALTLSDPADPESVREKLLAHFATDQDEEARRDVIEGLIAFLPHLPEAAFPHCEQAIALSRRLPIPACVPDYLAQMESRWDGQNPTKLGGTDVPLITRIIELALVVELYRRAGGVTAMQEVAQARAGGQFDPEVCAVFVDQAPSILTDFDPHSLWELYLDVEPATPRRVDVDQLPDIAEVFADFTDAKSGWFLGHSRQVARLAFQAADVLGLSQEARRELLLAGLLHNVGIAAVPNRIWDKRGPLTKGERRLAESHSNRTEDILLASPVFAPLLEVACSAHERRDGSGYHRRLRSSDNRQHLLAAADVYNALVHDRPWRAAFSEADAAERLLAEAEAGRLPSQAVRAVLEAAGHGKRVAQRAHPDGLTQREVDVLALLARGLTTKEIAVRLGVAVKTVDNHTQNLYQKVGATTRTAAAMYALERGIFSI